MRRWVHLVDRPQDVDETLDRNDPYAGVALLVLALNHPDPDIALPRILRGLTSPPATDAGERIAVARTPRSVAPGD